MKKIIATAAGLMIAGSALVASAAVEFSGDARARYTYFSGNVANSNETFDSDNWSHRVRLNIKATTETGTFAYVRLRIDDNQWNTGNVSDNNSGNGTVDAEYAYIGVPMGCTLLTAGRQGLSVSKGYFNDAGVDNVRLSWEYEGTTLVGLYGVISDDNTIAAQDSFADNTAKNDMATVVWGQAWNEDWSTTAALSYVSLDGTDPQKNDAMLGLIAVEGAAGPAALHLELGYQEKGAAAADDALLSAANSKDAFGVFGTIGMDFDALGTTLIAGYGEEGYVWDAAVGFMMLGGDGQLSLDQFYNLGDYNGQGAETVFVGLVSTYQATDDLGFTLNLGYVDAEKDQLVDAEMYEVSGQAAYTMNESAVLYARAGYVDTDNVVYDNAWAAGVSLELSF